MSSNRPNMLVGCASSSSSGARSENFSSRAPSVQQPQQQPQPPQQQPQPFSYVLLQLQRPNCTIPWGLSLTLFEERYLVLGDVNEVHLNQNHKMVQACSSTQACPINPTLFWTATGSNGSIAPPGQEYSRSTSSSSSLLLPSQIASFVQHLVTFPYCLQTVCSILPGDCILAVNGKTIAGNFTTLSQATRFLSLQTHLFLIILRLPQQQQSHCASANSSLVGQQPYSHCLHQTQAQAPSPTSTLRFPILVKQQQEQHKDSKESSIFQTAQKAWRALRLLNHHHFVYPSTPPLPPTSSYSCTGHDDSSWSTAADALLCLRGNNNNLVTAASLAATVVKLQQQQQQNQNGNSSTNNSRAFFSNTPLHHASMAASTLVPFAFWSPPPPVMVRGGGIYSPYSTTLGGGGVAVPSPLSSSTPHQRRTQHWPLAPSGQRDDFPVQRPILQYHNPLFREEHIKKQAVPVVLYRNPLFCENPKNNNSNKIPTEKQGSNTAAAAAVTVFGPTNGLPYDDDLEFEPDDGQRVKFFLKPIDTSSSDSFGCWLKQRKRKWRQTYKVYPLLEANLFVKDDNISSSTTSSSSLLSIIEEECDRNELGVAIDFWSSQGYASFQQWLSSSKSRWKASYSWNQRKRRRIQEDCDQVVRLISQLHHHHHDRYVTDNVDNNNNDNGDNFTQWLRVRKNQWRVLRRKRQREKIMEQSKHQHDQHGHERSIVQQSACSTSPVEQNVDTWDTNSPTSARDLCQQLHQPLFQSDELIAIDALLEDQERERERLAKKARKVLDISFLFDSSLDCPDDVVVHCFQYLDPMEHCKLLSLNRETRLALSKREEVWRQLCPTTWQLPRRPRKPWHVLYLTKLRTETEHARKRCDDLLARAANILLKGDQLQAIEKLYAKAQQAVAMPFDVNYSSGVVCERNSLLNLAVIHQRHKVVRWLVETMKADIETYDRGGFTPLLNAAWAGDRYLVRYFLAAGANRGAIGTCHYTKPLAAPDFAGHNASGWARKQGFESIATLIELGL